MPESLRWVCVILMWSRSGAAEPVPEPILTVGRYFSKSRRRVTSLAAPRLFLLAVTAERLQSTRHLRHASARIDRGSPSEAKRNLKWP